MQLAMPHVRRWTRREYHRMADLGWFRDQRVELINGVIIQMAPQRDVHAAVVSLSAKAVTPAFGPGHWVRQQLPLALGKRSEPEPDVSVVPGGERDYIGTGHPRTALLVIEVSDTTLAYDRRVKARRYARAGIADYWIVNLRKRQLEVYRAPVNGRYTQRILLAAADIITPLAAPAAAIAVRDLLP